MNGVGAGQHTLSLFTNPQANYNFNKLAKLFSPPIKIQLFRSNRVELIHLTFNMECVIVTYLL